MWERQENGNAIAGEGKGYTAAERRCPQSACDNSRIMFYGPVH